MLLMLSLHNVRIAGDGEVREDVGGMPNCQAGFKPCCPLVVAQLGNNEAILTLAYS